MPKDEKHLSGLDAIGVRDAIGRLISAGIANLGMQKKEFFHKFAPQESEKAYKSYVGAWNKVLTGERKIDLAQANILARCIPCGSEFLTAQEWHSLESYPAKIPERFYATHSFDFSSGVDVLQDLDTHPLDKKDSTQAIEIDKQNLSQKKEEAPIKPEETNTGTLKAGFDESADPFGLDSVTVKEIKLPNGHSVILSKPIQLSAVNAAIERMSVPADDLLDAPGPSGTD